MTDTRYLRLQLIVFALVSASFTNVYITQPVLPVLQSEFGADLIVVSLSVSAVILGIALSNLPFGILVDRWPIQPIILVGGVMVAVGGFICSATSNLGVLIGARFLQGLFIPALTTCLAAYLAKSLPAARLNVVMGSYVSATVLGGLGGRLLGGWVHTLLNWRYAFISAAVLIVFAVISAVKWLPHVHSEAKQPEKTASFNALLKRGELLRIYLCAAGSFAIFSSVFNFLPYRLAAPPFNLSTEMITLLYLVYITGIVTGPVSGRISNRFGSGNTLVGGAVVIAGALVLIALPSIPAMATGLVGICAGFFAVHSAAVGSLNRKLKSGQGRANALYVLFYYLGGWVGISLAGFAYKLHDWPALVWMCLVLLIIPASTGMSEKRHSLRQDRRAP